MSTLKVETNTLSLSHSDFRYVLEILSRIISKKGGVKKMNWKVNEDPNKNNFTGS